LHNQEYLKKGDILKKPPLAGQLKKKKKEEKALETNW